MSDEKEETVAAIAKHVTVSVSEAGLVNVAVGGDGMNGYVALGLLRWAQVVVESEMLRGPQVAAGAVAT